MCGLKNESIPLSDDDLDRYGVIAGGDPASMALLIGALTPLIIAIINAFRAPAKMVGAMFGR